MFQKHGLDLTVPQAQIDIVESDLARKLKSNQ